MKCILNALSGKRLKDVVRLCDSKLFFLILCKHCNVKVAHPSTALKVFPQSILHFSHTFSDNTLVLHTHTYVSSSLIYLENHIPPPLFEKNCWWLSGSKNFLLSILLFLLSIYDNESQVLLCGGGHVTPTSVLQEPGNVDLLGVWWFFTLKSQQTWGRREV